MANEQEIGFERLPFDPAAWDGILDSLEDAEVYHSSAWLRFLQATQGVEPQIVRVVRDGQAIGYLVGAIVRKYGVRILGSPMSGWGTPRMGFIGMSEADLPAATAALPRYAFSTLKCHQIELSGAGLRPGPAPGPAYAVETGREFKVDLTGSEQEVFGRMSSTTRNLVRRGVKDGLVVQHVTDESIAVDYHQQMTEVFGHQGLAAPYPIQRVRELIQHLMPTGQLLCLRVLTSDGTSIATLLTVGRNKTAVLYGAAFLRDHSHLHPNEMMHWQAMRYWHQRGATCYDMGGGGDYKRKYGAEEGAWYRYRLSRYPGLDAGRSLARWIVMWQRRFRGPKRPTANAS